jgi:ParB/RepB/Spo0J family partition protein
MDAPKKRKPLLRVDDVEPLVKLDAAPLQAFADGVAAAMGLETSIDKGLAAQHLEDVPPGPSQARTLHVNQLLESDTNPRRAYVGLEELAASIQAVGVLQPLLVRPEPLKPGLTAEQLAYVPQGEGALYEVVAGHRRLRAAKLAGLKEVPVDIRQLSDVQALELQLVENIQRSDLTPLEEAEGYRRLMAAAHYNADQVAAKAGKSRAWVYGRIKLLELELPARKALEEGKLSTTVAIALARVPAGQQAKALEGVAELPSREALEQLQAGFTISLRGAPFKLKDDTLVFDAGACLACPKRSGSGAPGLFDDVEDKKDTCTDVACYRAKCRASWESKAESSAKAGAKVLPLEQGQKLYRFANQLVYGGAYVEADAPAEGDSKKRTWAEQVEKLEKEERPQLVVACDGEWKLHRLYPRGETLKALAGAGVAWAEKALERKASKESRSGPGGGAEGASDKEEARKVRDQVVDELLEAVVAKVLKKGLDDAQFRLLARAQMARSTYDLDSKLMQVLGVEGAGGNTVLSVGDLERWIGEASGRECLAYLAAVGLVDYAGDTWSGMPEEAGEVAKAWGLDLAAMEAAKVEKPTMVESLEKLKAEEAAAKKPKAQPSIIEAMEANLAKRQGAEVKPTKAKKGAK